MRGSAAATSPGPAAPRRGNGDPVKALLHRHRELVEGAVDPLEIAAGLEIHGVTDRTAARFRHRDVFSLAEELYARVPRGGEPPRPAAAPPAEPVAAWAGLVLAPGAVALVAAGGLALTEGPARLGVGVAAVLALAAAGVAAVRRGPLRAAPGRPARSTVLWTLWLLGYAVAGDGLLQALVGGGPDALWPLAPAPLLVLALSVAPAAWCARLFSGRARRRLAASRGLDDFATGVRPLLLAAVGLQLLALTALSAAAGAPYGTVALGVLLLIARLLTVHGRPEAAAAALGAACAAEALALASVLAGRLPGLHPLAAPVRAVVDAWGPAAVPALVCGTAALALLAHATVALSRASAHADAAPTP
ncbi:hypothetical protein [Streptomyces solicathayae]|uniref:Integral membrane protein n=1 Tax=Streptomyces solicathayae TaxID=3081768 RepID=A0ABZ0LRS4_9ACTN|nr:hypothetical protein [Streptomyces sp. HUAS YS2]WOX22194.1 hypothetical protein R2D22_12670 [Streptomyces sp. HUAS YS2]